MFYLAIYFIKVGDALAQELRFSKTANSAKFLTSIAIRKSEVPTVAGGTLHLTTVKKQLPSGTLCLSMNVTEPQEEHKENAQKKKRKKKNKTGAASSRQKKKDEKTKQDEAAAAAAAAAAEAAKQEAAKQQQGTAAAGKQGEEQK